MLVARSGQHLTVAQSHITRGHVAAENGWKAIETSGGENLVAHQMELK